MIVSTLDNFVHPEIQSVSRGESVQYRLVDDYCFEWAEAGNTYRRTVFKNNWLTDLATTPDFASTFGFRKCGTSDAAATLHDRGYQLFGLFKLKAFPAGEFTVLTPAGTWVDANPKYWTREKCDRLYRRMCEAGGMPAWRAEVEFLSLRLGALSKKNGFAWFFS
jgi:hypothetical protein